MIFKLVTSVLFLYTLSSLFHAEAATCSQSKMNEILSPNTNRVNVNCNATLPAGSFINKGLTFQTSNVVFDCNNSTIFPADFRDKPAIIVKSRALQPYTTQNPYPNPEYIQTKNVTIKNCTIHGRISINSSFINHDVNNPSRYYQANEYVNKSGSDYIEAVRSTSPKNITLDNLKIYNNNYIKNTLKFNTGVTYSSLINSTLHHNDAAGTVIYFSPESGHNTIKNNKFYAETDKNGLFGRDREIIALDGSDHNIIEDNVFSGPLSNGKGKELPEAGIHFYRNCGEDNNDNGIVDGNIRYTTPSFNKVRNNIFYYSNSTADEEIVKVGSRNEPANPYNGGSNGHCNDDLSWGFPTKIGAFPDSARDNRDFATSNTITGNIACNVSYSELQGLYIVVNSSNNSGNIIHSNTNPKCDWIGGNLVPQIPGGGGGGGGGGEIPIDPCEIHSDLICM